MNINVAAFKSEYESALHQQWKAARSRLNKNPAPVEIKTPVVQAPIVHAAEPLVVPIKSDEVEREVLVRRIRCDMKAIIKIVAEEYGVRPEHIVGVCRVAKLVEARQVAMYLARTVLRKTYPEIGRKFKRDHSTAIHAIEKIGQLIPSHAELAARINKLKAQMSGGEA